MSASKRRELVNFAKTKFSVSQRAACRLFGIAPRVYQYQSKKRSDAAIEDKLKSLAMQYPQYGYKMLHSLLVNQSIAINHKKVHRLYKQMGLAKRRKTRKRLVVTANPLSLPQKPNHCWSIDFMSDVLQSGRRFRTFNVIDDFNRQALTIEIDSSLTSNRVIRALENIAQSRGYPAVIRCDNGPEFRASTFQEWAKQRNIIIQYIQPGKPTQNAFIERFNGTYRREILNAYLFNSFSEVKAITQQWLDHYNNVRPHSALGNIPPLQFNKNLQSG